MSHPKALFGLIAQCQEMTHAEIVTFTGWDGRTVSSALAQLTDANAVRMQNINGRRHYVIA